MDSIEAPYSEPRPSPTNLYAPISEITPFILDSVVQPGALPRKLSVRQSDEAPGLQNGRLRTDPHCTAPEIANGRLSFAVDAIHETEGRFSALIRLSQTNRGTIVTVTELDEAGDESPLSLGRQEVVGQLLSAAGRQYHEYRRLLPPGVRAKLDDRVRPIGQSWAAHGRRAA
jgi:hypothetical protein